MPDYEVAIKYNDEGALSARGAAEHAYTHLIQEMLYGSITMEIKNKRTGEVESLELESDVEQDESLMRFITLMMVASNFMTEEQKQELEKWEVENIDGHSISTADWPGWEAIIGKKPHKFRVREKV